MTMDNVDSPIELIQVNKSAANPTIRGRGGQLTSMYETHWKGTTRVSWEGKFDRKRFRRDILSYWAGIPEQRRKVSSRHRSVRKAS